MPLLCLPGLTRNVRDFADFATRLAPRHQVVVLEFRGRGESHFDPEPMRYLPPTYARDTIELLDHLGIAKAVFVGTSLGGIVAMLVAVMDGERIAGDDPQRRRARARARPASIKSVATSGRASHSRPGPRRPKQ